MKELKKIVGGFTAGFLFLLTASMSQAESTPATTSTATQGQIILSEVETYGVDPEWCHIPAVVGRYRLVSATGCYTDDYDLIRFVDVPSGLTVRVIDYGDCIDNPDKFGNWGFDVKTVKQPTTTPAPGGGQQVSDWIGFGSIWWAADGSVVSPGTMKVKSHGDHPPTTNSASCVIVTRD